MTDNAHEEAARSRKAFKLTSTLRRCSITPDEAREFTDDQWRIVADAAGTNPPSPTTIELALVWLAESEER